MVDFYCQMDASCRQTKVVLRPLVEPVQVMGAYNRLVQVLRNLVDNALSFSPPDQPVEISAIRMGSVVRIVVEDHGIGIPDNKLEAIFDRFYSERPKAEKFGIHSGLGLSISKLIVEAHSGRIWAENLKDAAGANKGARFIVELPILSDQSA